MTTAGKIYIIIAVGYVLITPFLASAVQISLPYWGPFVSCTGGSCTACDFFATAQNIIYFLMTLTLFVIGPIMIIAGGIAMLTAAGSPEKFSQGRKIATGAVIGIAISLGAFVIINTFLWALTKVPLSTGVAGSRAPTIQTPWPTINCY